MRKSARRPFVRRAVVGGLLLLGVAALPARALGYDIHPDRLNCPKGTTLVRIEINPRQCHAHPMARPPIPATRGRRACCTIDRDPPQERCLPGPGCNAASVE